MVEIRMQECVRGSGWIRWRARKSMRELGGNPERVSRASPVANEPSVSRQTERANTMLIHATGKARASAIQKHATHVSLCLALEKR